MTDERYVQHVILTRDSGRLNVCLLIGHKDANMSCLKSTRYILKEDDRLLAEARVPSLRRLMIVFSRLGIEDFTKYYSQVYSKVLKSLFPDHNWKEDFKMSTSNAVQFVYWIERVTK